MSKMGVRYIRTRSGPIDGLGYRLTLPGVNGIINREFSALADEALGEAQGFVDIAGTQAAWTGWFRDVNQGGGVRSGPSRGRVNTGQMRDALSVRITRGTALGLDIGWINRVEDYFLAQEYGFSAPGYRNAEQFVQGMGMFQHMRKYMDGKVSEAADRVMEEIVSGF